MNKELNDKLNTLLNSIQSSLKDIEKSGRKGRGLKKAVEDGRAIVIEVLEQQLGGISLEDQINISEIPDDDWLITVKHIIDVLNDPFIPQNSYEQYFLQLFNYITATSKEQLLNNMMFSLNKMKEESIENYNILVTYFSRFPLWGSFDPENGDLTTFELRASVMKHHIYDYLWLYRHTADYLSKRTLVAILMNWADLQCSALTVVKSIFRDYWEPDIFPDNKNDVLVDLGAYIGDSISSYIEVYGQGYKKIYAYEISNESYNQLCANISLQGWHDVEARRRGAGAKKAKMYVKGSPSDLSANSIEAEGTAEHQVDIVRIDDDVEETPTFIKMDIEGAEQDALRGCEKTIRDHHPKLAVCIYHGYEDSWKIPGMIFDMNPDYKFYIRHNGGNLVPTEFVLLCKP